MKAGTAPYVTHRTSRSHWERGVHGMQTGIGERIRKLRRFGIGVTVCFLAEASGDDRLHALATLQDVDRLACVCRA